MKYRVKNTVISHNKVLYPEGSIIDLEEKEALSLKAFLEELPKEEQESLEEESKKSKNSKKAKEINDDQNNETRSG